MTTQGIYFGVATFLAIWCLSPKDGLTENIIKIGLAAVAGLLIALGVSIR